MILDFRLTHLRFFFGGLRGWVGGVSPQDAKTHALAGDVTLQGIRLPGREMEVNFRITVSFFVV